ncbi:MAG: ribulose-phosphate 3-epimerase [Chloroflexi bacterium]|nr:ribulose-phosphate 3-epimerase [Chloroflexota bacterium]
MTSERKIKLAPSILSADFSRLGEQVSEATQAGADYIHLDVMDGQFVPNLTFGPVVIEGLKSYTNLPLDAHLMIVEPDRRIQDFVNAGVDHITVHAEACVHIHSVLRQIKEGGCRAGVALNPTTPIAAIEEALPFLDIVLILTVNPGFGGQVLIPEVLGKVRKLKEMAAEKGCQVEIEVDGGINADTAPSVVRAGADTLVAGSAVFNKQETVAEAVAKLRNSLKELSIP